MFILKLLRYIMGYVSFTASGGFSERFINLCAARKIAIREVKIGEDGLSAVTLPKNYKKLRTIAKNSGMKMKATGKHGLPFFLRNHKDRVGLLIGAVFFAVFMFVSSLFIWNIETVGAENVCDDEIIEAVKELGLKEGSLKRNIDTNELSRLAMINLSGKVSWLAVNVKGTRAVIEVRDYVEWREDSTYTEPGNIVADFDGLLLSVEVYNGQKVGKEGSGVDKGDLLISGIVENRDTSSQFLEARGKITALHNSKISLTQNKENEVKEYKSVSSVKKISIFGITVPLGFFEKSQEPYDEFENKKILTYGETKLPFAIIETTRAYYEQLYENCDYISLSAFDEYTSLFYEKYKNTLVLSSKITVSNGKDEVLIESESSCIDFMGVKQKIWVE